MAKRIESLKVIKNKHLTSDIFTLDLLSSDNLPEIRPGQFVEVKIEGSSGTFLRRPLSVHDVDYNENTIKLLVQIAGKGTETLSKLAPGDSLNIIYPLGNFFTLPPEGERTLLVGGGCGIAPLLYLGKYLKLNGYTPDIILGFRNSGRIIEHDEYAIIGKVYLTTEDGSQGIKGYVTDHPVLASEKYDRVYCCGPEPMMKAVAKYSKKHGISCEVSLENLMGCGIGVCLCCIVDTVRGNLCSCIDGPVFNISELKW